MSQEVKRQVSVESSLWLASLRKSLVSLKRAIPKDRDPLITIESINDTRARLVVQWSEWL